MDNRSVTRVLTADHVERMPSSVNGNPRYRVFFTNGTSAPTAPDASLAYGIENRGMLGVPKRVIFDGRGNVTYMNPIEDES
jgi:hypothetical protein